MTCGIYLGAPRNGITDKVYIGQSNNIEQRVVRHNAKMLAQDSSKKLNEAYLEYGEFSWEIIKECTEAELNDLERQYIKLFNAYNNGFNTYEDAYSTPNSRYGMDNGNVDITKIPKYKLAIDVTLANPTYSREKVSEISGLAVHEVSSLWYGKSYKWLADVYPVEYSKVLALNKTRQVGGKTAQQQGIQYPEILSPTLIAFNITNIREFARDNALDQADLSNVLNIKAASVKGWIVKNLDTINPEAHNRFYSSHRGNYRRQFDLYKIGNKYGTTFSNTG